MSAGSNPVVPGCQVCNHLSGHWAHCLLRPWSMQSLCDVLLQPDVAARGGSLGPGAWEWEHKSRSEIVNLGVKPGLTGLSREPEGLSG